MNRLTRLLRCFLQLGFFAISAAAAFAQAPAFVGGVGGASTRLVAEGQTFQLFNSYVIQQPIPNVNTSVPAVTGAEPLTYEWKKNGVPVTNGGSVSGAGTLALVFTNVQSSDAGDYTMKVTNALGSVTTGIITLNVASGARPYTFTTLAGQSNKGGTDGVGPAARFTNPQNLALAGTTLYIADSLNHVVRKLDTVTNEVTTLAGLAGYAGIADGTGSAARFNTPGGVAVDASGNVFVSDNFSATVRKITPEGVVTTLAGIAGVFGATDGIGSAARFNRIPACVLDASGNLYLADQSYGTIRKVNTATGEATTFAGVAGQRSVTNGDVTIARFQTLNGITRDASTGNLYVTDGNFIRQITPAAFVSTFAGASTAGSANGIGTAARFSTPIALASDGAGTVYVAESATHTIRKITSDGTVTTLAGTASTSGSTDGTGAAARFNAPSGIVYGAGKLYVADGGNSTIRMIDVATGVVTTIAGQALPTDFDGTGTGAHFNVPTAVAVDSAGNAYVADSINHVIRKITPAGVTTTFAGTTGVNGSANGNGSNARFNSPQGIAVDSAGVVYVADTFNHTIRKIATNGDVTTLAGSPGSTGNLFGPGTAARFNTPRGIAVSSDGWIYVADSSNHAIKVIAPDANATVGLLAGSNNTPTGIAGYADLSGTSARFNNPWKVAVDHYRNVWVADRSNSRLRMITPPGSVTTALVMPSLALGVAADDLGNAYVSSVASVWKYHSATGVVDLLGGGVATGATGSDDGAGPAAHWFQTDGLAVSAGGRLYVADSVGNTIRTGITQPVLTFPAIIGKNFGDMPFVPGASTTNGLAVSNYAVVSGPAVVQEGALTLTGPGPVTVRAFQEGNDTDYLEQTFVVGPYSSGTAITGAWSFGDTTTDGSGVVVFMPNGYYYQIQNANASEVSGGGSDGFEIGTYTWDSSSGAFSVTTLVDTNGTVGLSGVNGVSGLKIGIAGATLTFDVPGEGTTVAAKVVGADPIVGAWQFGDPSETNNRTFVAFLPNGYYFFIGDNDQSDPSELDGMEHGTYTWNSSTGAFAITSNLADTNGDAGLWGGMSGASATLTISGDQITLHFVNVGDDTDAFLTRVGTAGPVAKATPVIAWATPAPITFGTPLSASQLNATANADGVLNIPGTFDYTPASGTVLAAGSQILNVSFTPTDTANYNGASAQRTLTVNPYLPAIGAITPPRQIFTPGQTIALSVSATGTGTLSYQWFHNGHPIAGATGAAYSRATAAAVDTGAYSVAITDNTGTLRSPTVFVRVSPFPTQIAGWGSNATGETDIPPALVDAIAIDAGAAHSLALKSDGTVVAWGDNTAGQSTVPLDLSEAVAVAGGGLHSLALVADGTVVAWGDNTAGQTTIPSGLANVVAIAAGLNHSLALKADGTVVAWGGNSDGQTDVLVGLSDVVAIAAGYNHSLALKADGTVVAWGRNQDGQTDVPVALSTATAIAAGENHSLALLADGTVVAWGSNTAGQSAVPAGLTDVVAIAGGGQHSLVLKSDSTVVAWGLNVDGQTTIPAGLTDVIALAGGAAHSLALHHALPVIDSPLIASATYGLPFTYTITATNQPDDFDALDLPLGLSVNNLSGEISGIPGEIGGFTVLIAATNSIGTDIQSLLLTISSAAASINLGDLVQTYDGSPKPVTATTTPLGLATAVTYDGSGAVPIDAGNYAVVATITAPNFAGNTSGTLTISKATATINLSGLSQIFDATPKSVSVSTLPANLIVAVTYDGNSTPPTAIGSYAVVATLVETNYQGSVSGTLVIGTAPLQIVTQPVATTAVVGQPATFTVEATGTGPISYQWRKGTTDIPGATNATLSLLYVQVADAGNYRVVVSNSTTTRTSTAAFLTVVSPVAITSQPVSLTKNAGQNATFSVTATGTATLLYQWQKDDSDIPGATSRTLSLTGVASANEGSYRVVVTNSAGSVPSDSATLTVLVPVSIATQPIAQTAVVGGTTTFSVTADGSGPISYQWRLGTTQILGATSSSLTLTGVQSTDAGNYKVVVSNAANSVTSSAAALTVTTPVAITTQPLDVTKNSGQNANFSVTATGTGPLSYQWQKGGDDIAGATSRTLSLTGVTPANEGTYHVIVTNGAGSVTSNDATLTVNVGVAITTQPVAVTIVRGGDAQFSVVATGTAPLTYQWKKGNTNIVGATSSMLTLTGVQPSAAGNYKVVVSNVVNSVTSATASLTVQ